MATNNGTNTQAPRPAPAKGLLGGIVTKGEHMIALGCGMLLIVLLACALGGWWIVDSWTTPADPEQTVTHVRRGEVEHSSLDRCAAGKTKFYTQSGSVCR